MLRISSRLNVSSRKKVASLWKDQAAKQSTQASSKAGVKVALIGVAGVSTVVGGVLGFAAWSPDNRKTIEDNLPASNYLLEPILGPLVEAPKATKPAVAPQKPAAASDPGLLKKKLEREKAKDKELDKKVAPVASKSSGGTQTPITAPPLTAPPPPPVEELEKDAKVDKKEKSSSIAELENHSLAAELEAVTREAQSLVTAALSAAEDAANAVREHAAKAYAAIGGGGGGNERLYAVAAELATVKKEGIRAAQEKMGEAREKLVSLQEQISAGKRCKVTQSNAQLASAEERLSELSYALAKVKSTVAEALRDSTAVREFGELVEASRRQFESEVRSLCPDAHVGVKGDPVGVGGKGDPLSAHDLQLLLAHAHAKVLAMQAALAKQQSVDVDRDQVNAPPVPRPRETETKGLDGKMQSELERQRRDLGLEHRHRLQQLRDDLEAELRSQLKRQAAAHSDHLADVLSGQEKELEAKWRSQLEEGLQAESDRYYRSLAGIQGELEGLKGSLKSRADADKEAKSAHALWLACESLKTALRLGKEEAQSWEEQLVPLDGQVGAIKKATEGTKEPFIEAVLASLPPEALSRGVYTESALRDRFIKVDKVCRTVALVGENGGSLIRYMLSYVQSVFLVSGSLESVSATDTEVDPDAMDTHRILAKARYCLARDDLLQAVRYLNLLRGEPRHVAADWLREAKMALEASQVAEALMAHAAATGARAL